MRQDTFTCSCKATFIIDSSGYTNRIAKCSKYQANQASSSHKLLDSIKRRKQRKAAARELKQHESALENSSRVRQGALTTKKRANHARLGRSQRNQHFWIISPTQSLYEACSPPGLPRKPRLARQMDLGLVEMLLPVAYLGASDNCFQKLALCLCLGQLQTAQTNRMRQEWTSLRTAA